MVLLKKSLSRFYRIAINYKRIFYIVITIVLILLTAYILYKNISDIPPINTMNILGIPLCILSYSLFLLVASKRYLILVKKFGLVQIRFGEWFKIFTLGRFFNKFIPQAGNLFRAIILKSSHNFSFKSYTASMITFQWIETIMSLSISLIIILLLNPTLMFGPLRAALGIGLLIAIIVPSPYLAQVLIRMIKVRGKRVIKIRNISNDIVNSITNEFKDVVFLSRIILWGLLSIMVMTIIFYFTFYLLNISPGIVNLFIYMSLTRLILLYQLTPGNLGIQELFFGFLTEETGIGVGIGIMVSLVMRTNTYLTLGGFSLCLGGVSIWKDLQNIKKRKY